MQIIHLGTLSDSYFSLYQIFSLIFQMFQKLCMQASHVN